MAISIHCKSCSAMTTINILPCLLLIFLTVLTTFSWNSLSVSAAAVDQVSYADHCASIVPESTVKPYNIRRSYFGYPLTGYYNGGSGILSPKSSDHVQNSFVFTTLSVSETDVPGLFKLGAHIRFLRARTYYFVGNSTISRRGSASNPYRRRRSLLFWLDGFWSASSGNVCMVGSLVSYYSKGHNPVQTPNVVLKLHNLMNSSSFTTLISGTLESLSKDDPNNFEPASILMLPS